MDTDRVFEYAEPTEASSEINRGSNRHNPNTEAARSVVCLILSSNLKIKDRNFLEAFDTAATKTLTELGGDVREAILYHVARIGGVNSEDVLKDPLRFADALEQIFSSGSTILEDKIIDSMCIHLGVPQLNLGGSFGQKIAILYSSSNEKRTGFLGRVNPTPSSSAIEQLG
jgi:hypothetical protein